MTTDKLRIALLDQRHAALLKALGWAEIEFKNCVVWRVRRNAQDHWEIPIPLDHNLIAQARGLLVTTDQKRLYLEFMWG